MGVSKRSSTRIDQYTSEGVYIQTWASASEAARMMGLAPTNIASVVDHPTRTSAGFVWKTSYKDFEPERDRFTMRYVPSDAQYYEFNRRILRYLPVFYNLLKKYPFINPSNVDDYLQESLIGAWRKYDSFKHYEGDGAAFGGWCKAIFEYSILSYHAVLTSKLRFKVDADDFVEA
ncbi:MAG TPA: sigma factor, partial [Puia sp.]|nr:sigma factor [Puia sp.]